MIILHQVVPCTGFCICMIDIIYVCVMIVCVCACAHACLCVCGDVCVNAGVVCKEHNIMTI